MKKTEKKVEFKSPKSTDENPRLPVIFAPWRNSYIKRDQSLKGCVFCDGLKKGVSFESLIVYSAKTCSIFLNKFPYNNGHLLVIPHRHTPDLASLNKEEFNELHEVLLKAHSAIIKSHNPQGINIGLNLGRAAGAGIIDHLHYHLVPRWSGDTNFMPIIGGTKVISEELEQTYNKLLPLLV